MKPTPELQHAYALHGLGYADNNLAEQIDIKTVADWLGISYSYFYHTFARITGEPFGQYVKRHRLETGAGLLRHSDYNVTEISERTGYATVAAFTKAFTQHYGQSPNKWRGIHILPNEQRTLELTEMIVAATAAAGVSINQFFNIDRAESIYLPESTLYYNFLSLGQDPITQMIIRMAAEEERFNRLKRHLDIKKSMFITGTLDAVPVTNYEKLSMFAGLAIPKDQTAIHEQLQRDEFRFFRKKLPGGYYYRLPVPLDFASAGVPMYEFINRSCQEGIFKMSGNHFFISLTGPRLCEIYIPYMKRCL
ncbi:AraC family transcriptional regulator [Chitinophaga pendula]|uniref:helix-turn-helix transcriptional regulator n=1 Tax=Chitinophaga TaxID=79328 RepID=UPI000BB06949|nr:MULTISPECIES: AraC family transcriptional regulator [Chitinophaga]ASZ13336.1 hypothetical protein CK934_21410 [Chitinophaga sp. MD30]UCJ09038.1 AraC family transcriptional regulator [Chitinophaga pendula]